MLQLYNCTRIYIVNYRQSITLYIIYIVRHFSVAHAGESHKRPQKDEKEAVCRRSEHHNVFIGCQHQRCPYYCLGQRTGATLSLGNVPYRLQRVWFVASRLSVFAALPRTMDWSNV